MPTFRQHSFRLACWGVPKWSSRSPGKLLRAALRGGVAQDDQVPNEIPSSTNSTEKSQNESNKSDSKLKISAKQIANPDAWGRLIGPQNIAPIKIDGGETMVLLDGGAQISTISKKWVQEANLPIYELENLVEIIQAGGSILDYEGFTEVTITSDQIPSLDLTFPVLVVSHTDYHEEVPLTLGTKTLYHIYDSGILKSNDKLPTSWKFIKDDVEFKILTSQLGLLKCLR